MTSDASLVVVDASVVVKWFLSVGEDGVADAAELLASHAAGAIRLVAPALLAHELMGVLVHRLRTELAAEALDAFFDADVHLVPPDRALIKSAAALVRNRRVSTFDATYAALAQSLGSPLATADRRLANALVGVIETRVM